MGSVNVETGEYKVFNSQENWNNFSDAVVASASPPFLFPPTEIEGSLWMDGGAAYNLEIPSLVKYCRGKGFEDSQINLDVIMLSPSDAVDTWEKTGDPLINYMRAAELTNVYSTPGAI